MHVTQGLSALCINVRLGETRGRLSLMYTSVIRLEHSLLPDPHLALFN